MLLSRHIRLSLRIVVPGGGEGRVGGMAVVGLVLLLTSLMMSCDGHCDCDYEYDSGYECDSGCRWCRLGGSQQQQQQQRGRPDAEQAKKGLSFCELSRPSVSGLEYLRQGIE